VKTQAAILITWAEVMALARRASVGEHTARKIFWRDCPARKVLPSCKMWRYDRREVLKELGLPSDADQRP
jgi:hypothetical protein